jgi:hypothetical protein
MNLQEHIKKVLREIEENRVQIRLGRSAERHFGKVQNIIIIVDDQDITSEDDVPGLGKMNIVIKDNEIIVGDIFIPEKYRKQGIATIVYQKISDYFNLPIVNSKTKGFNQTIEGGYIWKKRERFEPKNLQEQISRMKSMMGIIKEQNDLICQHCNSRTKSNIDTLSGDTKIKAIKFIDNVFNKLGKTLTITNGYRSTEEQNKLYCQGRPKDQFCVDNNLPTDGKRVTTKKGGCSKHNYKEAFDVYFTKADGNPDLGTQMTEDVAKIGEELGLEWGGRWTDFTDKPHFQSPGRLCQ